MGPESDSKISNLMTTELFYSQSFPSYKTFQASPFSDRDEFKMALTARKVFAAFETQARLKEVSSLSLFEKNVSE